MSSAPDFTDIQYQFSAFIRDPDNNPIPSGIESRRMKIYSELFYNNVEDFMAGNFPVLRELFNDHDWHKMIRDYFSHHKARTPLFPEMAREFLQYLENERKEESDYPFLLELAHYEWAESAILLADEEQDKKHINTNGDLLNELPVLSSMAWLLSYHYPVHEISTHFIPTESADTHLLIYRDDEYQVRFIQLNPI
ncbi:MAG: putative DNA-binding domain-containing protein, partial [Gammaproteobacteria bacterium]|nr:putative DNA-binding domain-containing protein [Gammaproteobacteria bacterium]